MLTLLFILGMTSGFLATRYININKIKVGYELVKIYGINNSLKMLYSMLFVFLHLSYLSISQKLNKSIIELDKNKYLLQYNLKGKLYKIIIEDKKGPRDIIQVIDDEMNDVTDELESYFGPSENFHNFLLTPALMGKNELTFLTSDGNSVQFKKDDILKL